MKNRILVIAACSGNFSLSGGGGDGGTSPSMDILRDFRPPPPGKLGAQVEKSETF